MKKAIKINLGGLIFHIDEDAYDKLKNYLSSLNAHFGNNAEAKEIVSDVENRIAELLQSKINSTKQVINIKDIDDVIEILGNPTDFDTESQEILTDNPVNNSRSFKRRFYRDIDNAVLGGICSGLGAYFNLDPIIFRILFVLVTFIGGSGVPIYLILWIALPAARTAAQKLEMKGEDINLINIEKTIKQEFNQESQNIKSLKTTNRFRDFLEEIFFAIGTVLRITLKIIAIILGIILVSIGISLIIAFIIATFGPSWKIETSGIQIYHLPVFLEQFLDPGKIFFLEIISGILCLIPIFAIFYFGLKLIFRFKINDRFFWLGALATWIISIFLFIGFVIYGLNNLSEISTRPSNFSLTIKPNKVLYLKVNPDYININQLSRFIKKSQEASYYISNDNKVYGPPILIIEKANENYPELNIEYQARGFSFENASYNAHHILFDIKQKDSVLLLDPFFEIPNNDKWRAQRINLILKLPVGTMIFVDRNIEPLIKETENSENLFNKDIFDKVSIMTINGLNPLKK